MYSRWTALHFASDSGHLAVVTHLVNAGADVNVTEDDGETPLMLACSGGHLDVVKLLVGRQAAIKQNGLHGFVL